MFFEMYNLYNNVLFSKFSSVHPRQNNIFYYSRKTLSGFFHIVYDAILSLCSIVPHINWNLLWLSMAFYMKKIFLLAFYIFISFVFVF